MQVLKTGGVASLAADSIFVGVVKAELAAALHLSLADLERNAVALLNTQAGSRASVAETPAMPTHSDKLLSLV